MENSTPVGTTTYRSDSTPFSDKKTLPQTPGESVCTKLQSDRAALNEWNTRVAEIRKKGT